MRKVRCYVVEQNEMHIMHTAIMHTMQ